MVGWAVKQRMEWSPPAGGRRVEHPLCGNRWGRILCVLRRLLFLVLTGLIGVVLSAPGLAWGSSVVVSLTFDDGWDNQQNAYSMLAAHGMRGTFYVNSPKIEQSGYLTWAQLTTFNAAGNEIGGHTLTHPDLTTLTATQAQHEICDDRTNILGHGFVVPDFAYPGGFYDSTNGAGTLDASSIVRGCGYASGRGAYGLHNITATSDTRKYATAIPPANLYKILTPCCINHASFGGSTPTAAALESYVQHAQTETSPNPGWVIFVFHRVCDNCGDDSPAPSISPSEFNAFLDWLQSSAAVVKTVAQVIKNDTQAPNSSITCGGAACSSGWYGGPVSVSLSATDTGTAGVGMIRYTTDGSEPTAASPAYTAPFTVSATTTVKFRAWDNANNLEATKSRTIQIDTQAPSSSIACDGAACSSAWYGGSVNVSLSATDAASGVAAIRYTTDGSDPTVASPAYTAPFTVSTTSTVKYRAWDNAGNIEATKSQLVWIDLTAPTVAITSPIDGATVTGTVKIIASASDVGSGVAQVSFYIDGNLIGTAKSAPYSVTWNTRKVTAGQHALWAVAQDVAGNTQTSASITVTVR
jgi:peptidoglycan/xylan/chitin deacetylase (PgdA/CDA1 family)